MARPHVAALVEDAIHGRIESILRRRGWHERIVGYTGYGSTGSARVLARVLLTRAAARGVEAAADADATDDELREAQAAQRGWRAFLTAPAAEVSVSIRLGAATLDSVTDRSGYLDVEVAGHGLPAGWHEAVLSSQDGDHVHAAVVIVPGDQEVGLVSDIDDTVMITHLPRVLIAAWNTFVRSEQAREVVPGMAALYRSLLRERPGTPVFYLSTGAWNTAPTLTRFLKRHDYPQGPLLLTDWGPTNTGWFRSGQQHKREQLHRLVREFPAIRWILVGDDGQHDPAIYGEFATQHPEVVEAVAIRQLTPAQQLLSHGLPIATEELLGRRDSGAVPMLRAPDGFTLHRLLSAARVR